jgi:uncharacterized repeat protein (TIGR01451 family)
MPTFSACTFLRTAAAFIAVAALARVSSAQPYAVDWWTVDGGGGMGLSGGSFVLSGTAGQPDAGGPFAGGSFVVQGGFWTAFTGGGSSGSADLRISIADAPDPVVQGGTLAYTLQVTNLGPAPSTGMAVNDALAPGATFVSSVPGSPACTHSAGNVGCVLPGLAASGSQTVTITVSVGASLVGVIGNAATVAGNEADPVSANNSDFEQTTVIPRGRTELTHGSTLRADLAAAGGTADVDLYRMRQKPYSSYEVVVDASSGDVGLGEGPELERVGPDGSATLQTSQPVGSGPGRSLRWENTTPNVVDDQFVRVRSLSCGTDCGPDDVYRIRARETTGSVPRFNNSGTQVSVVLLQNAGAAPVSGRIYFWNTSGSLRHTQPFSVAPRGLYSFNPSSVAALQGASGTVTVSSDAPYGVLVGKVVALEPSTGYSFDSVMESRPR